MLTTRLLTDPAELEALRGAWTALLARSEAASPMLGPTWLLSWWRLFGGQGWRALRTLAFFDKKRLVGLAPLLSRPHLYRGVLPFRRLELLASGEREEDSICSDYIGVLAERGREEAVATAFADGLARDEAGRFDELVLPAMNGDLALPALLAEALRARGLSVEIEISGRCPYVPLPDSWDAYLQCLPPTRRAHVRRSLRSFERWGGADAGIVFAEDRGGLAEAQRVLAALHEERWGPGGRFASPRFRRFHELVQRELIDEGALELGWLEARGGVVAAFYNLVGDGKTYFYQSGRRLDVPKDVRVGVVMHALLIGAAIERGRREYDFLAGESRYKATFALQTRPLVTLRAARPSLIESARRRSAATLELARQIRNRWRARSVDPQPR